MPFHRRELILGGSSFTPKSLSNLFIDWDPTSLSLTDGTGVATWTDASGNGNTASQATGGNQPTFKTGIVNAKPILRFNGTSSKMTTSTPNIAQPYTAIVVGFVTTGQNGRFLDTNNANRAVVDVINSNGHFRFGAFTLLSGTVNRQNAWHIFSAVFNGASSASFVDGAAEVAGNAGAQSWQNIIIGSDGGSTFFAGDLARGLVYKQALTTADRRKLEAYLSGIYGVTVV